MTFTCFFTNRTISCLALPLRMIQQSSVVFNRITECYPCIDECDAEWCFEALPKWLRTRTSEAKSHRFCGYRIPFQHYAGSRRKTSCFHNSLDVDCDGLSVVPQQYHRRHLQLNLHQSVKKGKTLKKVLISTLKVLEKRTYPSEIAPIVEAKTFAFAMPGF